MANLPQIDISVWCQWKEEDQNRRWGLNVDLVESITAEFVLERVKVNVVSKEETINLIKEKLNPDADVACESISVSLQCPVGCIRMKTPVRTRQCTHFQVKLSLLRNNCNQGGKLFLKTYSVFRR